MPFVMLMSIGKYCVQCFIYIFCRSLVLTAFSKKCKVREKFCLSSPAPLLLQIQCCYVTQTFFCKNILVISPDCINFVVFN